MMSFKIHTELAWLKRRIEYLENLGSDFAIKNPEEFDALYNDAYTCQIVKSGSGVKRKAP